MSINRHPAWNGFVQAFNRISRHQHRYEVFRDFVTMAAIAMHNAIVKDPTLEAEYLAIVKRYNKEEAIEFSQLLARLVLLMDDEPRDVLGPLYMELELGNDHTGQFFTPHEVCTLMAQVSYGAELAMLTKPFVTLSEPACGAGGMVLAFVNVMRKSGHDPAKRLWVHCQDIDRTAALMCYLQLSLWHVPGVVVVGNTLTVEAREVYYTPAHHLGFWENRLRRRDAEEASGEILAEEMPGAKPEPALLVESVPRPEIEKTKPSSDMPLRAPGTSAQFDFGF